GRIGREVHALAHAYGHLALRRGRVRHGLETVGSVLRPARRPRRPTHDECGQCGESPEPRHAIRHFPKPPRPATAHGPRTCEGPGLVPWLGRKYSPDVIRLATAAVPALLLALAVAVPACAQLCTFDLECDDAKECTTDSCDLSLGTCSHVLLGDGESCGGACTACATCQGGDCVGGTPVAGCVACRIDDDCEDS